MKAARWNKKYKKNVFEKFTAVADGFTAAPYTTHGFKWFEFQQLQRLQSEFPSTRCDNLKQRKKSPISYFSRRRKKFPSPQNALNANHHLAVPLCIESRTSPSADLIAVALRISGEGNLVNSPLNRALEGFGEGKFRRTRPSDGIKIFKAPWSRRQSISRCVSFKRRKKVGITRMRRHVNISPSRSYQHPFIANTQPSAASNVNIFVRLWTLAWRV